MKRPLMGLRTWFMVVSSIQVIWGLVFVVLGLRVLPVNPRVLVDWESTIYGAIMMGWGVTLWLIGRIAFKRGDPELARALLTGIGVWLAVEAFFSARLGVWFNVGVDGAVFLLLSVPLFVCIRSPNSGKR